MHNKFCVFDDNIILTGSFNPTASADTKQNNNLVIIESKTLARNYNDEFQSFLNDKFGIVLLCGKPNRFCREYDSGTEAGRMDFFTHVYLVFFLVVLTALIFAGAALTATASFFSALGAAFEEVALATGAS